MHRHWLLAALFAFVAGTVACGGSSSSEPADVPLDRPGDPGTPDSGLHDPGFPDPDAGDLPLTDHAPSDLPESDIDPEDAIDPDAGETDASYSDIQEDAQDPDGQDPDVPGSDAPSTDGQEPDGQDDDATDPDATDPDDATAPDATAADSWEAGTFDPENCELTAGSLWIRLEGDLLVPDGIVRGGALLIDQTGLIACVGLDCAAHPEFAGATVVACERALITPAMINGHDHITFTGNTPKSHGNERYDHRHEWRKGLNQHTKISVPFTFGAEAWGELRNVLAGTTSMFGSGKSTGLLRNLDQELLGLDIPKAYYDTFPLGDGDGIMLTDSCAYPSIPTTAMTAGRHCYVPHVAEGVNAAARNEFLCLAGLAPGGQDNVLENAAFIHGVGLLASDIAEMAHDGTALIWSPRTNVDLYGNTASIVLYDRLGVTIGLGTDWTASGSVNMMRELACADELNRTFFGRHFTDRDLFDMATIGNARAFKVDPILGSLEVGKVADVSVFHTMVHRDLRAVIDGGPADVALVLRGGTPLYGDAHLVPGLPGGSTGCEVFDVCEVAKSVCAMRETGKTLAQLKPTTAYDLFFCGLPDNEPSCIPFRPGEYDGVPTEWDADGDGIPDGQDNCPALFNPIRPVDGGVQADADGDGLGDLCDPCPLDPFTTECTHFDPDDRDADGVPNVLDNCPAVHNPDQEDWDEDGKGDACDPCPYKANPGNAPCPESIYDVKRGVVPLGSTIRVIDGLVTALGYRNGVFQGFFIQVDSDDPAYDGAEYSGLYCYGPSLNPRPVVGSFVTVDGTVNDYHGQIQLSVRSFQTTASWGVLPDPVPVGSADVATGGALAAAYEGVVVRVADVTTLDVAPAAGGGDTAPINEFVVTGGLRVNDFVHLADPFPLVGDEFAAITGVVRLANDHSKLEPRGEFDIVRRNIVPKLTGFGPARVFMAEGQTAVPLPDLVVRLQRPVDSETFIAIASGDPLSANVPDGGVRVPAGAVAVQVPVEALAPVEAVTLTASLDGTVLEVTLRVIADGEVPVPQQVLPNPMNLTVGDVAVATVFLDIPALDDAVVLSVTPIPEGVVQVPQTVTIPLMERSVEFDVRAQGPGTVVVTLSTAEGDAATTIHVAEAPPFPRVFFSEYIEGSSFNKALEIFNNTGSDLLLSRCTVRLYSNGAASPSQSVLLSDSSETIAHGATFVACHPNASELILGVCGLKSSTVINYNGDDALDLVCDGQVVDVIGQVGVDPGSAWVGSLGKASTLDRTLRRKCGVTQGDPIGSDAFDPDIEWDNYARDTFSGLGTHEVACP